MKTVLAVILAAAVLPAFAPRRPGVGSMKLLLPSILAVTSKASLRSR